MLTASISWNYTLADNTAFLLQRSTNSGSTWTANYPLPVSQTSYLDTTVVPYGTYWYHVAPTNKYGTGSFSNTGSVFVHPGGGDPPQAIPMLMAQLPAFGYKICGWDVALGQMTTSSCNPSVKPEWDAVFNQLTTTSTPYPYPLWYFTGSSIGGNSVSADDATDYPTSPTWQDNDTMTKLFWYSDNKWHLQIACANGTVWWMGTGDGTDINNPSGSYLIDDTTFGAINLGTTPEIIVVKAASDSCPLNL